MTKAMIYPGLSGRRVAIDLSRVEAILEEEDGRIDLFTSSDWYRIRAPFEEVAEAWKEAQQ